MYAGLLVCLAVVQTSTVARVGEASQLSLLKACKWVCHEAAQVVLEVTMSIAEEVVAMEKLARAAKNHSTHNPAPPPTLAQTHHHPSTAGSTSTSMLTMTGTARAFAMSMTFAHTLAGGGGGNNFVLSTDISNMVKWLSPAVYKLLLHVLTKGQSDLTLITCYDYTRKLISDIGTHARTDRRQAGRASTGRQAGAGPGSLSGRHEADATACLHVCGVCCVCGRHRQLPGGEQQQERLAEADRHLLQPPPASTAQRRAGLHRVALPLHLPQDRSSRPPFMIDSYSPPLSHASCRAIMELPLLAVHVMRWTVSKKGACWSPPCHAAPAMMLLPGRATRPAPPAAHLPCLCLPACLPVPCPLQAR